MIECQKHYDYQEYQMAFLSYAEEYAGHGKTIAGHSKDALTSVSFTSMFHYPKFLLTSSLSRRMVV